MAPRSSAGRYGEFGERLCLTCSWQKQSSVLVHMVTELGVDIDVVELDTHLFFRETYETRERLVERYGLHADPPGDHHRGRAARAGGPEPVGARPRPLLPHPQGRAAHPGARAVRRLDLRHPPRPVADRARTRRRSQWSDRYDVWKIQPLADWTRRAGLALHRESTTSPTTRCTTSGTARSAASPAPARRARTRRSARAAGQARTSSSAASIRSNGESYRRQPHDGCTSTRLSIPSRTRIAAAVHALVHRALRRRQDARSPTSSAPSSTRAARSSSTSTATPCARTSRRASGSRRRTATRTSGASAGSPRG